MEIVKTNTKYSISDALETWKISGTLNEDVSGALNFNIDVVSENDNIGSAYYNRAAETGLVNVNYNVKEANRTKFIAYFDGLVAQILNFLEGK